MVVIYRLNPLARALRRCSLVVCLAFIFVFVSVICLQHVRMVNKQKLAYFYRNHGAPRNMAWRGKAKSGDRGGVQFSKVDNVGAERTNLTVILEHVQVDYQGGEGPWMFSNGDFPFDSVVNDSASVYARTNMSWNAAGNGNGSCNSGGSGKKSRGYLDPYNYFLGLQSPPDFQKITVEMTNLSLSEFTHINTVDSLSLWNTTGQAGDSRLYRDGILTVSSNNTVLLSATDLQWIQNYSYPAPAGESKGDGGSIAAYLVAKVERVQSNVDWVSKLDPQGTGFILGIVTAAALGSTSQCITSHSYWITLRPYPDFARGISENAAGGFVPLDGSGGAKSGTYQGSSEAHLATAQTMSGVSKSAISAVVGIVVSGAVASTAIAVVAPALCPSPPGQGLTRLLATTAFVAKVNEVQGFHTEAMSEFADGIKVFIGKLELPFSNNPSSSLVPSSLRNWIDTNSLFLSPLSRQQEEPETTVSDEVFGGCAFYNTLIIVGFLSLHALIWAITRKKPVKQQLVPHAWMVYIFSIVMSYVYDASVLNSMQYLRSHISAGTGKAGFYVIAALQLLLVGVGFTAFFMIVLGVAWKRVQQKRLTWVPKNDFADPMERQSIIVAGQYEGENDTFHSLFECYYSSLAGPRVWIASLELSIVLLDSICTALIWNEVICLGILVGVYALLFIVLLTLAPFADKVEGGLVVLLGVVELVLLILEFMGALGDFATAEIMEFGALILGFISIGLAVLIAVYCDLLPIVLMLWSAGRKRFRMETVVDGKWLHDSDSDSDSDWSAVSHSNDAISATGGNGLLSRERFPGDEVQPTCLVAFDRKREAEVRGMLAAIFSAQEASRRRRMAEMSTSTDETISRSLDTTHSACNSERSFDTTSGGEVQKVIGRPQAKRDAGERRF